MQSLYLRTAYDNALSSMNQRTWAQCTSLAIEILSDTGFNYIKNEKTIRRWHLQFRKSEQLIVPNSKLAREPKLFNFFPEAKTAIEKYRGKEINIGSLSSEALRNHINTTIIPECYQNMIDDAKEDRNSMPTYMELLHMLDLTTISLSTVWRWLVLLGFKYSENKKYYYTDGHEREDVVNDRDNRFLIAYFKSEKRTHRWVQIHESVALTIENDHANFPKDCYYSYSTTITNDQTNMREHHVDTHPILLKYINVDTNKKYGGNLSVKRNLNKNPLIIIGQDKSTFHQFIFSKMQWKGPQGHNFLIPKSDGEIYMVSGLSCREFGLGLRNLLTPNIVSIINENRRNKDYELVEDAKLINNTAKKPELIDDPCLHYFHAGVSFQGYWNSSHAKIQLEDVLDCLLVLLSSYDFGFLFDQSAGHTKLRTDGLSVRNMNVSYGGAVNDMRTTKISEVGQHASRLTVGDHQKMTFDDNDEGPFWMNQEERLATKNDRSTGVTKRREKLKNELLVELRKSGVDTTKRRFLKSELITLCTEHSIPIFVDERNVEPGWFNKLKGMLQILFERGWIDETKVKTPRSMSYSKEGKKDQHFDEDGKLNDVGREFCLTHLLLECIDFKSEKSDLEHLASELSNNSSKSIILFTPKFHYELAGEGIECAWGAAKRIYRRQPLSAKRTFGNVVALVKSSLASITTEMCRRFSAKARGYMLGYYHQNKEKKVSEMNQQKEKREGDVIIVKSETSYQYNEKNHKIYRLHCDANCTDWKFIGEVIKECTL